jgi:hypothetical protein
MDTLLKLLPLITNLTPVVVAAIVQLKKENPGKTADQIFEEAGLEFDELIEELIAEMKK